MTPERKYSFKGFVHLFEITADKGICFYTTADCLVWFTLLCVLAKKYNVRVLAVCIMLNHFHIEARFPSRQSMSSMMRELTGRYTQLYNRHYQLSGPLFRERYGSSLKVKKQHIRDNFVYICNNPIGKKAVSKAEQYRWNFLAYMASKHPFSRPIVVRRSSKHFLCARAEVLRCWQKGLPLNYLFFSGIYDRLSNDEKKQIIDLVISTYNVIDYAHIKKVWGDYEQVCGMLHTISGSEYDLADDDSAEDYKHYYLMIRIVEDAGFDLRLRRFAGRADAEIRRMAERIIARMGATKGEIAKFLHFPFPELFGIQ